MPSKRPLVTSEICFGTEKAGHLDFSYNKCTLETILEIYLLHSYDIVPWMVYFECNFIFLCAFQSIYIVYCTEIVTLSTRQNYESCPLGHKIGYLSPWIFKLSVRNRFKSAKRPKRPKHTAAPTFLLDDLAWYQSCILPALNVNVAKFPTIFCEKYYALIDNRHRCCTALTLGPPATPGKHSVKRITTPALP